MKQRIVDYLSSLLMPEAYGLVTILVEMALITLVVYMVLRFLHGTRGARLLQGLMILLVSGFLVVAVVAEKFHLDRLAVLYRPFVWTVLLTALVVFQPELRRGLMRLGETRWRRSRRGEIEQIVRPIVTACTRLSKNKIGALIAIERDIGLSGISDQGVRLDARLTPELLESIFWPGGALHDLGVIVQRGRVAAAGCPFPLGDAEGHDRSIGSRHRAAIGLSLDSDAIIVVVSEETGAISIAEAGRLYRHIPAEALAGMLTRHLARNRMMPGGWSEGPESPPGPFRTAAPTEPDEDADAELDGDEPNAVEESAAPRPPASAVGSGVSESQVKGTSKAASL